MGGRKKMKAEVEAREGTEGLTYLLLLKNDTFAK